MPKNIQQDIDEILASEAAAEESGTVAPTDLDVEADRIAADIDYRRKFDKPLTAFGAGAARGISMGLSDPLLTKSGLVDKETLKGLEEVNPAASVAGEIAGTVGGIVIPGGPVAAAAKTGRAVESALIAKAALTAAEKSAARRIMSKASAAAAGAAAEGALYGTGQLISEEALGDAEFNAQNLVSAAGSGAVLGGLVGGAFGTAFGSADELGKVFQKDGKLKRAAIRELDEQSNAIDLIAQQPAQRARLEKAANENLNGEGIIDFAKYLRDDLKLSPTSTRADLYNANIKVAKQASDDIKQVVSSLDASPLIAPVPANAFEQRLLSDIKTALSQEFKNPRKFQSALAQVQKEIRQEFATGIKGEAVQMLKPSNVYEFMQRMGKKAFEADSPELTKTAFTRAWGASKDVIREYVEKASDAQLASNWERANKLFKISKIVDTPLSLGAATNDVIGSYKDVLLGSAGAALGGPAAAVAAVTAKRFLESDLKRKLVVLGSVEKSAANSAKRIAEATLNFFTKTARGVKKSSVPLVNQIFFNSGLSQDFSKPRTPIAPTNDKQAFKNMQKNVSEYASNPEKLAKSLSASTQKMDAIAPKTAQAARETMVRAVQFLDSKLPKDRNQPYDLFQSQREFEPSSQLLAKFKRYVQVVEDPYSVLADLESGTATQEHVEALKVVYPAIYSKIRTEMLDYVIKNPTELDFNKKTQLGILLQAPVTPAMRGKSVANLQATFIPKEDGEAGQTVPMTVGGLSNMKIAENESTSIEKIQSGEGS